MAYVLFPVYIHFVLLPMFLIILSTSRKNVNYKGFCLLSLILYKKKKIHYNGSLEKFLQRDLFIFNDLLKSTWRMIKSIKGMEKRKKDKESMRPATWNRECVDLTLKTNDVGLNQFP